MLLDLGKCRLERLSLAGDVRLPAVPEVLHHRGCDIEQLRLRLGASQNGRELALDHVAANRLAVAGAALLRTLIVGVALFLRAAADRPAGRQWSVAVVTQHEAAQREILAEIGAVGRAQAVEAVLGPLERLIGDQRLVMAFAPRDAPDRRFDVARIDRVSEQVADTLMRKFAVPRLGVERMLFEEAHHIGLRFQLAGRVALEGFRDDGGLRFLAHEHPAIESGHSAILVTGWSGEHGKAVRHARLHPVERLLAVVDAVIVGKGDRDILHEARRRALIEHACRRFENGTEFRDFPTQIGMIVEIAREAIEMVKDHAIARALVLTDESKHRTQTRTLAFAAGEFVPEHRFDVVAHPQAVIAQTRFLRSETVALTLLLLTRNPAIDDRGHVLIVKILRFGFHAGPLAVVMLSIGRWIILHCLSRQRRRQRSKM